MCAGEICAILYGAESRFHVCTQVHGVAECTKQGRASAAVRVVLCGVRTAFVITPNISSPSLPHCLICQSLTTVASFPLSPLFFSFSNPPLLFFLRPVLPLCRFELLIIYLRVFFSVLPSLLCAALLQSVSLSLFFYPLAFFPPLCLFPSFSSCSLNVPLCE